MLARNRAWQVVVCLGAVAGILLVHEWMSRVVEVDERSPVEAPTAAAPLKAGARVAFEATAYCKGTTTAAGTAARAGVLAADPQMLPEGSVVHVASSEPRHAGIYTVLDTGPNVRGARVDLYMWSCYDALAFGRQPVTLTVLRLGWAPSSSLGAAGANSGRTR